jgi:hypothetical protein
MKPKWIVLLVLGFLSFVVNAGEAMKVRGLCISAPAKEDVEEFVNMIDKELAPMGVNVLILRIDYGYRYEKHPELVGNDPLEKKDVRKIVKICRKDSIRLIPQVNLLGHQSWSTKVGKLLEFYPEFDETPGVQLPAEYKWPNPDGLYCKSYCPLHPDVHRVVFDIIDEIVEVFEADAFHAGMDEVFYLGHKQCKRCNGRDPAELFAGEVTKIHDHLALNNKALWMWGDRLIDGKMTGIGEWEASYNNTHRAIDLIPKDVVICDWHYEQAHPTPVLFAAKGLQVVSCPWRKSSVALDQVEMIRGFLKSASRDMKPRYAGIVHTYWNSASQFMDGILKKTDKGVNDPSVQCFLELVKVWQ